MRSHESVARLLIEAQANVDAKDSQGRTPLQLCQDANMRGRLARFIAERRSSQCQ
jgi:hypothetical protein